MDLAHDRASIIAQEDRISNLPDDIVYRILYFLDMKYAIQTSTLSKKWKNIWTLMPHLNLNSRAFRTFPRFAKFVNDALSHRNHRTEVSSVHLSFRGAATQFAAVVRSIVTYAYSHNVRQLILVWFRFENEVLKLPQRLFSSHTLKHLTLTTHYFNGFGLFVSKSAWDFPVLETLNLSNIRFGEDGDRSLNLFSKCVNLKNLTLHNCAMWGVDIFNVCAPQLSNLTIIDPVRFPKVFNVVSPQLESLTASVMDMYANLLQLSIQDLDSLEKVNLSLRPPPREKERYAPRLLDLFHKLCGAKFLILDKGIIEVLYACLDQLSDEPCPFNNLKWLKQKDIIPSMPTQVRNYLLESSPSATFIMDLPQVPQKRSREEVDKGTKAKALSSCTNQLSHKPSPFNNLKCLNQTHCIPRMPTEVRNHLLESSPCATFIMDLPQVPHKRSRQEADNDKQRQQTETMYEEKRMLEEKIFRQDEVIAEQKAMLEAMKLQHEKRMLEAKIHMQDKIIAQQKKAILEIIARQKAMLETTKLVHENGMLEEKVQMQDNVIAEQKEMLEVMKLQNAKKMSEAKILRQDKIIAQQKAMLEAMKLQHEKIETEVGNIDS